MADNEAVRVEDLLPVRSRVSWGAIFAGAVVALALYFLLTLLGGAVGLSVGDRVRPQQLATGAAVWAVLVTVLSLFVGGYVTSQCSVGENKFESVLYGVILWGVLFGMLLWLMASGVRSGFNAVVGMSQAGHAVAGDVSAQDWEAAARKAGVPQERLDEWRAKAPDAAERARLAAEDQQNQQAAADAVTRVTWWAFLGTVVSMLAAVAGSYVGAGPRFRLVAVPYLRARNEPAHRQLLRTGV
jgi:uncharacterized membrane protein